MLRIVLPLLTILVLGCSGFGVSDIDTRYGAEASVPDQFPLPLPPDYELVSSETSTVLGQPAVRLELKSSADAVDIVSLYEQYYADWGVVPERQVVSLGTAEQLKLTGQVGNEFRRVKVVTYPSEPALVTLWWRSPTAPISQ